MIITYRFHGWNIINTGNETSVDRLKSNVRGKKNQFKVNDIVHHKKSSICYVVDKVFSDGTFIGIKMKRRASSSKFDKVHIKRPEYYTVCE